MTLGRMILYAVPANPPPGVAAPPVVRTNILGVPGPPGTAGAPGTPGPNQLLTGLTLHVDSVNGNDATAARGDAAKPYLTPAAALTAAQAGDLVAVSPSNYAPAGSLVKDGVNWHLDGGGTLTRSDKLSSGDLFGDGGVAVSFVVDGAAVLVRTVTGSGNLSSVQAAVVRASNAASDVSVRCRKISCSASANQVLYGVACQAGSLRVEADRIEILSGTYPGGAAVWWDNGSMQVRAGTISAPASAPQLFAVIGGPNATPTGDGDVRANEIKGYNAVWFTGTDATAATWVESLRVRSLDPSGVAVQATQAGRAYLTTQKVFGRVLSAADGPTYLTAMKLSAIGTGTPGAPGLLYSTGGAGTATLELQEADPAGFTGDMVRVTGGNVEIRGMRYVASAGSLGVEVTGGTLRLIGCRIDTSANAAANPVTVSGGTLVLEDCVLVAAGGRNAIEAPTPQTVTISGTFKANTALHANVTLSGGWRDVLGVVQAASPLFLGTVSVEKANGSGVGTTLAHDNTRTVITSLAGRIRFVPAGGDYVEYESGGGEIDQYVNGVRVVRWGATSITVNLNQTYFGNNDGSLLVDVGTNNVLKLSPGPNWDNVALATAPRAVTLSADQDDYNPGAAGILRVSMGGGSFKIKSLAAGADGQRETIHNADPAGTLTLCDAAGATPGTTAAWRFDFGGADLALPPKQTQRVWYDAAASRWKKG